MQAKMRLLLTPTVGATSQPAAPSKTHGNESDLEAPKLKVSHYVCVAMGAEWRIPHPNRQAYFPKVSLAWRWEGTQLNSKKFSWTWELSLIRAGQTRQKSLLRLCPSLWDYAFWLLADIWFHSYLREIMKLSFETLNTSMGTMTDLTDFCSRSLSSYFF